MDVEKSTNNNKMKIKKQLLKMFNFKNQQIVEVRDGATNKLLEVFYV